LILHDKVRSEALAVRPDANGVTLAATLNEGFACPAFDRLQQQRKKLNPLMGDPHVSDGEAYRKIGELSKGKLDALIDLRVVELLTCHALRETALIHLLAKELAVNFRREWRPDAAWLANFKKVQLSHLLGELYGKVYDPSRETRKKSELVEALANVFADAAEGTLEDEKLAGRVNTWQPSCLSTVLQE
jgi:hypothetical protein